MIRNVENFMVQEYNPETGKWKSRPQALYEGSRAERLAAEADPNLSKNFKLQDLFWEHGGEDGQTENASQVLSWNGTRFV